MRISDWSSDVCSSDLFVGNSSIQAQCVAKLVVQRHGRKTETEHRNRHQQQPQSVIAFRAVHLCTIANTKPPSISAASAMCTQNRMTLPRFLLLSISLFISSPMLPAARVGQPATIA